MDLSQLDVITRVAGATLLLALAALLARDPRTRRLAVYFAPMALCLAGFLAGNTPEHALRLGGPLGHAAVLSAGYAAGFLWWFYALLFVCLALAFPNEPTTTETMAFQLTMPGLEEEAFYRGLLLLALDRAFTSRARFLRVDWSWGAVLSCVLFGLAHTYGISHGKVSFDPLYFALTAGPSLIGVWVRLRTGSLLLPVLMHNIGNAASLLL